jgi:hypothetical protein
LMLQRKKKPGHVVAATCTVTGRRGKGRG